MTDAAKCRDITMDQDGHVIVVCGLAYEYEGSTTSEWQG